MLRKEHGGQENKEASDEVLYKIDIPANRYDMLCLEGIARALNIFNRTIPVPQYKLRDMTGIVNVKQAYGLEFGMSDVVLHAEVVGIVYCRLNSWTQVSQLS